MAYSESMHLELKELRQKVEFLKQSNKSMTEKLKTTSNNLNSECYDENKSIYNALNSINECELNNLINKQEILVATNCFRKSLKLIEDQYLQKINKKKHKMKLHICNEKNYNISFLNTNSEFDGVIVSLENREEKNVNKCESYTNANQLNFSENSKEKYKRLKNIQYNKNISREDVVYLKTELPRKRKKSESSDKELQIVKIKRSIQDNYSDITQKHTTLQLNNKSTEKKLSSNCILKSKKTVYKRKFRKIHKADTNTSCNIGDDVIYIETMQTNDLQNKYNVEKSSSLKYKKNKAITESSDKNENICETNDIVDIPHPKEIPNTSPCYDSEKFQNMQHYSDTSPNYEIDLTEDIPEWDFTEEPVDFPIPLLHGNGCVIELSKEEERKFKFNNVEIKKGHFTNQEEVLLKRNFDDFKSQFKINDVRLLLGLGRHTSCDKAENVNALKFLKAKQFYVRLGKGLSNRTLFSIYRKARHMFDPLKNMTKHHVKDLPYLLQLQKKYGNKWQLISHKLRRTAWYCKYLYERYTEGKLGEGH